MLSILSPLSFVMALGLTAYLATKRVLLIKKTIQLGRAEDRSDAPNERLKTMLRVAFGQKKMFDRPIVGLLHFIVYAGFLLINVELIEIVIDGLFGTHRVLAPLLGSFYPFIINTFEILAALVIVACVVFLFRRYLTKVPRLDTQKHRELDKWPALDATIILVVEIILMSAFLTMNTADRLLQVQQIGHFAEVQTGDFLVSSWFTPLFENWSVASLQLYERATWWVHILGIFAFAVYVTYSKHLHIILAFPNTYFANRANIGTMKNMPEVTHEVKIMLGLAEPTETPAEVGRFGAKDVQDLSWKNLMDAYSCTECGRCTSSCPANLTGKALSPRKIMMDTRDRLEDIQKGWIANGPDYKDDKTLLGDYISQEEILACTTCNACVEACPILISPLDIITQLRRYQVMEESQAPQSWNMMFQNLETNMAPWKFSSADRMNWTE